MSGGQVVTVSQGTISTSGARTAALVGAAIVSAAGAITGGSYGQVVTLSQGTMVADTGNGIALSSHPNALTVGADYIAIGGIYLVCGAGGFEGPITSAIGTLTPRSQPPAMTGQVSAVGAGILVAQGTGAVTVHITGEDLEFFTGTMGSGGTLISGQVSTSAQGAYGLTVATPLAGESASCSTGTVASEQDANDTRITSGQGSTTGVFDMPLVGTGIISAQGVVFTGDGAAALTGQASTVSDGLIGIEESYPLTGEAITSAQEFVGAPGGVSLTGSAVVATAGFVFLTNDRSYPLVGASVSMFDGSAVTSYLAFPDGQELAVGQGEIGPRTVELTGASVDVLDGRMTESAPQVDDFPGGGRHRPHRPPRKTHEDVRVERIALGILKEQEKPKKKRHHVPLLEIISAAAQVAEVDPADIEAAIERIKRAKRQKDEELLLLGD